jgi:anti-sigma regulatory factor (Ser/Thr protein kinase)
VTSASRTFLPRTASVPAARRFVREQLAGVTTDQCVAELLVSELATNAVAHADTAFAVRVDVEASVVWIAVENHAPELLAVADEQRGDAGGLGLRIIDALSRDWGAESGRDEKLVWFELPRSP